MTIQKLIVRRVNHLEPALPDEHPGVGGEGSSMIAAWESYADQAVMHLIAARMSDWSDVLELMRKARADLECAIKEFEKAAA